MSTHLLTRAGARAGFVTLALGLAVSYGTLATQPAVAAGASPRVVYGADNRQEVYQLNAVRKKLAASTVAMVTGDPKLAGKPITLPLNPDLQTQYKLCDGQRFAKQPVPAFCSGALVAADIVLTAGHCVKAQGSKEGVALNQMLFVFDFDMQNPSTVAITFPGKNVYAAKSLIRRVQSNTVDYALIRLDRNVAGRPALKIAPKEQLFNGKQLFVIGHPSGLPTKLADHASITRVKATTFTANLDTFEGNSGSPIFSAQSNAIIGVLDSGKKDYVRKGNCNVVNTLPNKPGGEGATRASALPLGALN
ncbi:MAG: serine protease [Geminicoccaceae bacterium]